MRFYDEEVSAAYEELKTTKEGLSTQEAKDRVAKYGANRLEAPPGKSLIRKFLEELADPMIIILIVAAIVSGVLAVIEHDSFADVIIIISVVIINSVLGVYQESKAEKAIEALQEMSKAKVKVFRDGALVSLESDEIVPGDIVAIEAGDQIPADGRLIESASLKVEESALTGESVAVEKTAKKLEIPEELNGKEMPLGDRKNMVYMGSSVAYGRGLAVICSTGMNTEMGKIAGALSTAADEETPLQLKLKELSKTLTWLVLIICALVFGVQVFRAGGFETKIVLDSFMVAVSLAVAAIPEGLAAVVTIVLSIGVTNMSKKNAIIRRLTAVETLGCASVICSDKTGTLTQNKMTVTKTVTTTEVLTAQVCALCSDAKINQDGSVAGEPTEVGLSEWALKQGMDYDKVTSEFRRIGEAPFDSERKLMSTVCILGEVARNEIAGIIGEEATILQYTKGAPDVVIGRCTKYIDNGRICDMTPAYKNNLLSENKGMADQALRVIACAIKVLSEEPESYEPDAIEQDLVFTGLCGMIDPVRPEVKPAIDKCESAGIRPVMITGDHVDTASAIAKELGILKPGMKAITGTELSDMDDETFAKEYQNISVYARVQPEHKTRIVSAWRKDGYVTAMTGDGVNDAPAIKTADIGVGMGITGTDVTKNVADMVLTDDNFATIVGAVEEGRRIYDNIRKAIQFLLGSNLSEVLGVFFATLLGFVILKPVHLLWINLITDSLPALALGMEMAEPGIMNRKPRDSKQGIFGGGMGVDIFYQGAVVAALVMCAYLLGSYWEKGAFTLDTTPTGITMAFVTMSMTEICHSFNLRSQRGSVFSMKKLNKFMVFAAILALALTTFVCETPGVNTVFALKSLEIWQYGIALCISISIIPIVEIVKAIQRNIGKEA